MKPANKNLEDRIRHMQEYPEECSLEPLLPVCTQDTRPVDQPRIYETDQYAILSPSAGTQRFGQGVVLMHYAPSASVPIEWAIKGLR
jgi:hypothetical protein